MVPTRMRLTDDDKRALRAYWEFFEPIAADINKQLRNSLSALPEWSPILRMVTPEQAERQERESRARQHEAMIDGNWAPYLQEVRAQGIQYAKLGISFVAWYDIIAIYRELIRQRLTELARDDLDRATLIGNGMNRMIDIAMSHLGEAYLSAKEQIIAQQQEAIRELSLPVLQVRERVLIVPLVGMIDSTRARLLIETLLGAIRDKRAHGVVIDVTGIPIVDTAVANHLVQCCDAASLMGTRVVITGISPDMARTLVSLGAKLPAAETLGDLQEGIEYVERALGYRHDDASEASPAAEQVPSE